MIIDMHCHLDLYPDPFTLVKQCDEKGLYILSVTTTPKAWKGTSKLVAKCSRIRTALGLHPQLAHHRFHELDMFDNLLPQTKYVGEIGLDGGKEFRSHWNVQIDVFRHILQNINKVGGRIMSIHSRASTAEVLSELSGIKGIPILHWFTGNKTELKQAINRECWFSIGPAMLATKRGQNLISLMPKNKVLTETDGPFAKWKGKSLMPWDIGISFELLSKIWNSDSIEVRETIQGNFKNLLSLI